jgi:hypothetical protein
MKRTIRLAAIFALTIIAFALSPKMQAVTPPPDGGYPGGNTAEGQDALLSLTTGTYNTAVGLFSLRSNTIGSLNTAVGAGTLFFNVGDPNNLGAIENTAVGAGALFSNTLGAENTANGAFALARNTSGDRNTAMGAQALLNNTEGGDNSAFGDGALEMNTIGYANTAVGGGALFTNTEGHDNIAIGLAPLSANTIGHENTAVGDAALEFNTEGSWNTAVGEEALANNTTGTFNTAIGLNALPGNTTGSDNIALGAGAGSNITTASHVICIGDDLAGANVDNTCFIGHIRDVTTQNEDAVAVVIDSAGQLGTMSSSRRFKKEIKPMDNTSESILALKPVTFRYKNGKKGTPQFGLIAEEVAKVNPDLVVRDKDGEIYTVRYDAVNAMLLNEFLKEHRKVQELKSAMAQQQKTTEALMARLNEQEARIQKVSGEVEARKSVSQMLVGNQ